ncbi:uncharacterized protein AB675_848 [Cyphellophora attinorum]|uniref:Uncharacterized protein n=1 Tax=Cyphellophora attinorum TaxID=1664694 RepID=A0A0N1I1R9_9EURO|nr:uncharacterized protein AB675_848 [Phialophora attinorum]KPI45903.1 hypothetical protein AB675_848 [Phialophora attinorum]
MCITQLILVVLVAAGLINRSHAKLSTFPRLTRDECVIGTPCRVEWTTDDCTNVVVWKLWLNGSNPRSTNGEAYSVFQLPDVIENACHYTMSASTTSNLTEGAYYYVYMFSYDASFPDGFNNNTTPGSNLVSAKPFQVSKSLSSYSNTRGPEILAPQCQKPAGTPLSVGAIAGIAVGVFLLGLVIGSLVFMAIGVCGMRKEKARKGQQQQKDTATEGNEAPSIPQGADTRSEVNNRPYTAELDQHRPLFSERAIENNALPGPPEVHPGTPFIFGPENPESARSIPASASNISFDVHELSSTPVRPGNDIFEGPGQVKIEPVGKFDDTAVPDLNLVGSEAEAGEASAQQTATGGRGEALR